MGLNALTFFSHAGMSHSKWRERWLRICVPFSPIDLIRFNYVGWGKKRRGSKRLDPRMENAESALDLFELFIQELPGVGLSIRGYRALKKRLSREYRQKIDELEAQQVTLIETISDLNEHKEALKDRILALEAERDDLRDLANPSSDGSTPPLSPRPARRAPSQRLPWAQP